MNNLLENILKDTLVLAKSLDLFDEFRVPGKDYNIIACQSSEELIKKYPNIYVDEVAQAQRTYSTSKRLLEMLQDPLVIKKYLNCNYIWAYQAYSWTNDLKYLGKRVFSIDYYLYLKLQNKLIQRKLLIEKSSLNNDYSYLKNNLITSYKVLKTKIFQKQKIEYKELKNTYNGDFVLCASNSNGGEGVFKISNFNQYEDALRSIDSPVIRTEKFVKKGIPLNQIAFIMSNGIVVKYKPSVQIIKSIHQDNKMEYAGCDFSCEHYLRDDLDTLENITKLTDSIGKILFKMGYRGTFGCDYLAMDNDIHFIELNPRYQASTLIPNLHLGNDDLLAPHILHILGFVDFSIEQFPALKEYACEKQFINFTNKKKPIGFLNVYDTKTLNIRKPIKTVKIGQGISKGYLLFSEPMIKSPYYPTKLRNSL